MLFQNTLGLASRLPVSVSMLLLFIANLHANGAAPASIVSTVSAVAYFHKINGFPDPSHCFLVAKVLAGARNLGAVPDVRLPVTLPVLTRLVQALPRVISSHYKCLMLRAMMVLAFKAYLRVGEMVPRSKSAVSGCLHVADVFLSGDLMSVSFRRFKHSITQGPQFILVKGECIDGSPIYPACFMREFLQARGSVQATLFAFPDGTPLLRREFDAATDLLWPPNELLQGSLVSHRSCICGCVTGRVRCSDKSGRQVGIRRIQEIYSSGIKSCPAKL